MRRHDGGVGVEAGSAADAGVAPGGGTVVDAGGAMDGGATSAFVARACDGREKGPGLQPRCGSIRVPERRDDPAAGTIEIKVAIYSAAVARAGVLPVIYLAGGAGGSSIANAVWEGAWNVEKPLSAFLENRDVIAIDLRGSGGSTPSLSCGEMAMAALSPGAAADAEFDGMAVTACRRQLQAAGATLTAYGTAAAAHDVQEVIEALGLSGFDVVGSSYGARVALELVRRQPAGLHAMVFDSVAAPGGQPWLDEAAVFEAGFARFAERCTLTPACQNALPAPLEALRTIVARLEAEPVDVDSHGGPVRIDARSFLRALWASLRDGDFTLTLGSRLAAALRGDYGYFAAVLGAPRGTGSIGVTLSVACAEQVGATSPAEVEARAAAVAPPFARALVGRYFTRACPLWNVSPVPAAASTPLPKTSLPVLFLAGSLDPVVAPTDSAVVAQSFVNTRQTVLPGYGHSVLRHRCAAAVAARFLATPTIPIPHVCPPPDAD